MALELTDQQQPLQSRQYAFNKGCLWEVPFVLVNLVIVTHNYVLKIVRIDENPKVELCPNKLTNVLLSTNRTENGNVRAQVPCTSQSNNIEFRKTIKLEIYRSTTPCFACFLTHVHSSAVHRPIETIQSTVCRCRFILYTDVVTFPLSEDGNDVLFA